MNLRRNFRLCLGVDTRSLRLSSVAMSDLHKIIEFLGITSVTSFGGIGPIPPNDVTDVIPRNPWLAFPGDRKIFLFIF